MSWHLHRWSRWELADSRMIDLRSGREFSRTFQHRECEKCGKHQVRSL